MKEITQKIAVFKHMQKHGSITSMDAFELYGATRLSAIIYDLRHEGHQIGMVYESGTNRYGEPVHYGRYFIEKTNKKGK